MINILLTAILVMLTVMASMQYLLLVKEYRGGLGKYLINIPRRIKRKIFK